MLTDSQKQFFHDLESLFRMPGWDRLVEGWQQEMQSLPEGAFWNTEHMKDLAEARVRWRLLKELTMLPESIEAQKAALLEQQDEDDTF